MGLLNVLALKFTPSGSIGAISMEIQEMLPRFREVSPSVMIKVGQDSRSGLSFAERSRSKLPNKTPSTNWQSKAELPPHIQQMTRAVSASVNLFDASMFVELGELVPRRSACPTGVTGNIV